MSKYPVSEKLSQFSSIFNSNSFKLYIVGGAVRDYLLGIENHDYDFCTDATPQQVMAIFHKVIPTGIKHGTVTVLFKGESFEVTTFRTEGTYSDNRHPDNVTFVTDLHEDLSRRDFTINAFAADCEDGEIIDLFNGMADLRNGIVRAIGNPVERFTEDALRMMRLARFCSKLGFMPEDKTKLAAKQLSQNISVVSQERIYDELSKMIMSKRPTVGLQILQDCNLLYRILPELEPCALIEQDKVGSKDVLGHIFNTVDATARFDYGLNVRMAALLHDIGKPSSMRIDEKGVVSFYGHETVGASMAIKTLRRLKCSNQFIDEVSILIANHMVRYQPNWTDGAVKRFIKRVGNQNIDRLFELQWCDQIASEGKSKVDEYDEFIQRIQEVQDQPMTIKDLEITGDDLFSTGIPKSKVMGQVLEQLLELVLDDPSLNEKKTLLEKAGQIYKTLI